jgi:hypothetical protein
MKRLFILGIGVFLSIFIMSIPVWAAVDISGQIFVDTYYYHQDAQGFGRLAGGKTQPGSGGVGGIPAGSTAAASDRNQTYFDLNHATALRFLWTNEEGVGAFTAIYMNTDPTQSVGTDPGFKVGVAVALLYWDITKDLRLTAGRGGLTEVFSPFNPTTYMGYDGVAKVEGLGYGNVNSKYEDNLRFTYKFGKVAALDLALLMPRLTPDTELAGGAGFVAKAGTTIDNVSTIPKIEFGVPLTFGFNWGRVAFTPSAMYLQQQFNNVGAGDSSITSYGLSAGGSIQVAGLKLTGEYNYGQNLPNAGRPGESQAYPFKAELINGGLAAAMAARVFNGNNTVYNATTNAFWVQLGYTIADRISPTLFYGMNNTKRDMPTGPSPSPATGLPAYGNTNFTTQFYGINIPILLKKNLSIVPEFMIYDNGSSNQVNGTTYDFGKEWLAGVEFRLFF